MRGARAERLVAALLGATAVLAVAFVVVLAVAPHATQWLGLCLGGALAALAAALVVAAKRVLPTEQGIEPRPPLAHPEETPPLWRALRSPAEHVSRRRLLALSAAAAGTALAAAVAAPLTALGPSVGRSLETSPWRRGRRLVDEQGRPVLAADIVSGSFVTAFPEGADRRALASPVVVVRDDPARLRLPAARADWAPDGLLAYSKICTHAGCAIALYRKPTYEPTSKPPALGCPCHYSVFDTRGGGTVEAGPAGRPLPQLPLRIGPGGELRAAGGFSGPVGPSWWSVRS